MLNGQPITIAFNDLSNLPAPNKVYVGGWINAGEAVASAVTQVATVQVGTGPSQPGVTPVASPNLTITENTATYYLDQSLPAPLVIYGTNFGFVPTANNITFYEDAAGTIPSPVNPNGSAGPFYFSISAGTDSSLTVNFTTTVSQQPTAGALYAKITNTWAYSLQSDGTFSSTSSPSVPFFEVSSLGIGISFDQATNGNDRLVYVVAPSQPSATSSSNPWQNFPINALPTNTSTVPPGPWGFLEFGYDAQFNTSYVDSFGLNWSFVDDAVPNVVYGALPTVYRSQIQTAYPLFTTSDPLGSPFAPLMWTATTSPIPAVVDGQFTAIVAPKDWLANPPTGADTTALTNYWTSTVNEFFTTGNQLNITLNGNSYSGSSNGTEYTLTSTTEGTVVVIEKSMYAGTSIFTQLQTDNSPVVGQIKSNVFEAFSRGVSLDGVWKHGTSGSPPAGYSSNAWTNYPNWYVHGPTTYDPSINRTYDVYAKFFHYATTDGKDFRSVTGGKPMLGLNPAGLFAMAYGFSLDESPSVNTKPSLGFPNNVWPADATVNGGTTINGGGSITVTFGPWTPPTPSAPTVVSMDTSPPQVGTTPTPTNAASVTWTVTFSEPVKGATAANFALVPAAGLTGTSITSVVANGGGAYSKTWTVTANTGSGSGTLGLNLTSPTGIVDQADHALSLPGGKFVGQVYSVRPNPVGPTVTITRSGTSPTDATTVSFAVTFSEAAAGLTAANFTTVQAGGVTGSFVQSVSGGGTSWTVTVNTGTGSGTLALEMANSAGVTPAVTGLPVTSLAYTIDKHVPVDPPTVNAIARVNPSPTSASSVSWYVLFSEPVTGVTAANFTLVVGGGLGGAPVITSVSPVSTANTSLWTITASTGTGSGTLGLNMTNSTGVHDAEHQAVEDLPFVGAPYAIDRTAPAALSIVRAGPNPTTQTTVSWTVSFSKAVGNVSKQNFQLVSNGLSGSQITQVVEAPGTGGLAWTVTALTGSGNGTIQLNMVNATGITDAVNLPPTGIPLAGETYQVQRGTATIVEAPIAFMTTEGVASRLVWMMPAFTDADSVQLTATLAVSPSAGGTLQALSRGGVTVTPSGTSLSELQFSGTQAALNAYFSRRAGFITYTPAVGQPLTPRTLTLAAQGSDGLSGLTTAALLVRATARQNPPPRLRAVTRLAGQVRQPLVITYDQFVAATRATQTPGRSIQFMLGGVQSGSLEVWTGSRWAAVPRFANMPLLAPGGQIRWTPPGNASGLRAAFTVRTWDGWRLSALSQVRVNLAT